MVDIVKKHVVPTFKQILQKYCYSANRTVIVTPRVIRRNIKSRVKLSGIVWHLFKHIMMRVNHVRIIKTSRAAVYVVECRHLQDVIQDLDNILKEL